MASVPLSGSGVRSSFPHEVAEMALGHAVADAVERAYRRGDLLEKRRQLAEVGEILCGTASRGSCRADVRGSGQIGGWMRRLNSRPRFDCPLP